MNSLLGFRYLAMVRRLVSPTKFAASLEGLRFALQRGRKSDIIISVFMVFVEMPVKDHKLFQKCFRKKSNYCILLTFH